MIYNERNHFGLRAWRDLVEKLPVDGYEAFDVTTLHVALNVPLPAWSLFAYVWIWQKIKSIRSLSKRVRPSAAH